MARHRRRCQSSDGESELAEPNQQSYERVPAYKHANQNEYNSKQSPFPEFPDTVNDQPNPKEDAQ